MCVCLLKMTFDVVSVFHLGLVSQEAPCPGCAVDGVVAETGREGGREERGGVDGRREGGRQGRKVRE